MEAQYDSTSIVGRPTMMATFDGHREAQPIIDALTATGHPLEDVSVLLRPAGTDAVEDLVTATAPPGSRAMRGCCRTRAARPWCCCIPRRIMVEAVRAALTGLGAENIEYEPETVYTGAQSAEDYDRGWRGLAPGGSRADSHRMSSRPRQAAADTSKRTSKDQCRPCPISADPDFVLRFVGILLGFIVGTTFHEFSHAYTAVMLGDDLPRRQGRITLNPVAHFDPLGFFMMVLLALGIGFLAWGRPVQVNPYNLRFGRRGMALVAMAGPVVQHRHRARCWPCRCASTCRMPDNSRTTSC